MNTQIENVNKDIVSNNPLYKFFSTNDDFWKNCPVELIRTPWRGGISNNSLTFKVDERENQIEILKRIFGIDDQIFDCKYKKVVRGNGHEKNKIMTLHSSSLISLLCFYKVDKQPLVIEIKTEKEKQQFCFTGVSFELKNDLSYAYKQGNPDRKIGSKSNMDVMLFDGNFKDPKNVLFLESKFSEYLHNGAVYNISQEAYNDIYEDLKLTNGDNDINTIVDTYVNKDSKNCFKMMTQGSQTCNYLEGVKQMISHFMGACTYASEHPDTQVYLGSIVYQFKNEIDKGKFENYKSTYQGIMQALQKLLEKHNTCSNLHLIDNLLTYNEVFSKDRTYKLDEKVAQYYFLE